MKHRPVIRRQTPSWPPRRCSDAYLLSKPMMKMLFGGKRRRLHLNSRRRRIKARETNIDSLPDEVLFDILVRFPADFLHHIAKLVCRRWCRIILSDDFINTHCRRHSTNGLVLASPHHPDSIYVTATQGGLDTSELTCILTKNIIATSCNGLALEFKAPSLYVVNPATKQSFRLPSLSTYKRIVTCGLCGIAYCAASGEYKVTLPYYDRGDQGWRLDIVTVGVDKSWRRVEVPHLDERDKALFSNLSQSSEGFLHWGNRRFCLTMNVETEIVTISEAPIHPPSYGYSNCYNKFLSTGKYLTLLVDRGELRWEVWEMRPAESGDQWRKAVLAIIDLGPQKSKLIQVGIDKPGRLFPVGWVKYPEVLAFGFGDLGRTCTFYNLDTHDINAIDLPEKPYFDYRALVHTNRMAWLSQE